MEKLRQDVLTAAALFGAWTLVVGGAWPDGGAPGWVLVPIWLLWAAWAPGAIVLVLWYLSGPGSRSWGGR